MTPLHNTTHPVTQASLRYFQQDADYFMDQLRLQDESPALIFADPPFNIGAEYDRHGDALDEDEYVTWTARWIEAAANLMADDGSLWVNVPDRWAANVVAIARDLYQLTLENWCIWHFRFGVHQPHRFIVSKTHALWFSKGSPIVNREAALVPSDRAAIYNDPRAVMAGERMDLDVWGFEPYWGRVTGNSRERQPLHPNQLPERYLQRVIGVCSNPGQLVVDPFCGSGTTAAVAGAMGRDCATADISRRYLESASQRQAVRV